MSIKLIATDLDGTLLNEKGEVSALTRKVFLRAQQEGIRIVLATGRDLPYFSQAREPCVLPRKSRKITRICWFAWQVTAPTL